LARRARRPGGPSRPHGARGGTRRRRPAAAVRRRAAARERAVRRRLLRRRHRLRRGRRLAARGRRRGRAHAPLAHGRPHRARPGGAAVTAPTIVARGHRPGAEPTDDARPRRHRGVLALALGLLVLAVVVSVLTARSTSDVPLAPDNPDPDGARALAQVLREQGVSVTYVRTTAAALAEAGAGTTLLVLSPETLRTEQREALAGVAADVVLADVGWGDLAPLTSRVRVDGHAVRESRPAGCDDPHAQAAGEVTSGGPVLSGTDAVLCFAGPEGAGYAAWTEGDRQWRAIADGWVLSNDGIATAGNAARVLRTLGAPDRLVWYLPNACDPYRTGPGG